MLGSVGSVSLMWSRCLIKTLASSGMQAFSDLRRPQGIWWLTDWRIASLDTFSPL